jgi:K+/H+ antiporter YhaU regulatory subunit KhtT
MTDHDPTKVCLYHGNLEAKIDALCEKIDERDKHYYEREVSSKEAIKAAFNASERAAEKTETALKEYKISSNEWRDTVKDLVSKMITRPDVERELKVLENQIADLREYRSKSEGRAVQQVETKSQTNWGIHLTVVIVLSVASLILSLVNILSK